jgi:hypothetical protein
MTSERESENRRTAQSRDRPADTGDLDQWQTRSFQRLGK